MLMFKCSVLIQFNRVAYHHCYYYCCCYCYYYVVVSSVVLLILLVNFHNSLTIHCQTTMLLPSSSFDGDDACITCFQQICPHVPSHVRNVPGDTIGILQQTSMTQALALHGQFYLALLTLSIQSCDKSIFFLLWIGSQHSTFPYPITNAIQIRDFRSKCQGVLGSLCSGHTCVACKPLRILRKFFRRSSCG